MKDNRSVTRILQVLDLIAQHDEGLTLGQIYRMLDMPKATVYDFLQTLYHADAIYYKDPRLKNYVIGSKMFAIGSVYTKNSNLIEVAQFELKEFANRYGKTVFITKRVSDKIVYVFKYQPQNSRIVTPQEIGSISTDFHHNSVGLCYLVFDKAVRDVSVPNFERIKKERYLFSNDHDPNPICTLTAPVWNFEKRVVGVIVASDLCDNNSQNDDLAKAFVDIAGRISRRLGYLGSFDD